MGCEKGLVAAPARGSSVRRGWNSKKCLPPLRNRPSGRQGAAGLNSPAGPNCLWGCRLIRLASNMRSPRRVCAGARTERRLSPLCPLIAYARQHSQSLRGAGSVCSLRTAGSMRRAPQISPSHEAGRRRGLYLSRPQLAAAAQRGLGTWVGKNRAAREHIRIELVLSDHPSLYKLYTCLGLLMKSGSLERHLPLPG